MSQTHIEMQALETKLHRVMSQTHIEMHIFKTSFSKQSFQNITRMDSNIIYHIYRLLVLFLTQFKYFNLIQLFLILGQTFMLLLHFTNWYPCKLQTIQHQHFIILTDSRIRLHKELFPNYLNISANIKYLNFLS